MEEKFKNWMVEYENKAEGTVYSYSRAIEKISKHYSEHKGSPINIFEVSDVDTIDDLISHYNSGGKYEAFGNIGHKTNINGLKSYARFLNNATKNVTVSSINTTKNEVRRNVQTESAGVFSHFDQTLRKEALRMSDSYKLFYGLEVSIRNLIKTTMEGRYGEGWWKWIDVRVKENVKNHLA